MGRHLTLSTQQFWCMFALALIGFADALFLSIEHYRHLVVPCYVGSCEVVLTSPYAIILGVPVAVGGIVYYGMVLFGLMWYVGTLSNRVLVMTLVATLGGLLASAYFFALMAWVIGAWCHYCLLSGAVSLGLCIVAVWIAISSRLPSK